LSISFIVEEKRMYVRVSRSISLVFALAMAAFVPVVLSAQDAAKPPANAAVNDSPSRWDIFLGYSYLAPKGTVGGYTYNAINYSPIASISVYFNKNLGVQFEGDEHVLLPESNVDDHTTSQPNNDFSGGSGGIIYRFPSGNITPFLHALVGAERVGSYYQTDAWGPVVTLGGGLDYNTPWFNHHLAIRLVQADYQYTRENFPESQGGTGSFNIARLSAGLVFHIGNLAPPVPVTLACSANPSWVYPGDPVTVTATAGNLNPKLTAVYSWSGSGATGNGTTASVATGSLAPGSYEVKGDVKEGKANKPYELADCSASFTVKPFEPPTTSCTANPSTIKPGETSTVTAVGMSPQNRPLTYSYSAAAGAVSGTGTTAEFNSTGAPVGPVAINCNVADDKGGTATASTSVTIAAPYVAPAPHAQALCSITFEKDPKRPDRVDNDAKACLDEVALDLQKQSDATVVVVGDSTAAEKTPKTGHKHAKSEDFAGQRAVNTKDYLVTEKGIDASRITVKTGGTDAQEVQNYLVPSGADFATDVTGTTAVDETAVKPQTRKALSARPELKHKKAAEPPAAQ
jgi:outer membrane protein OmpA-like peptidoglycan-associated protein